MMNDYDKAYDNFIRIRNKAHLLSKQAADLDTEAAYDKADDAWSEYDSAFSALQEAEKKLALE